MSYIRGMNQNQYKRLILENADNSCYAGQELTTDQDKIDFLWNTLNSEMGWKIEREGLQSACLDWLQGLASACTIPFYNVDIIAWAQGPLVAGRTLSDVEVERLVYDMYWNNAAGALTILVKKATTYKQS